MNERRRWWMGLGLRLLCLSGVFPVSAWSAEPPTGFPIRWGDQYVPWSWCHEPCISIAANAETCFALLPDGTLYGCCITNVKAVAAAEYHYLTLFQDGTVQAWGRIYVEGRGLVPDIAPAGLSNVVAIVACNLASAAFRDTTATILRHFSSGLYPALHIAPPLLQCRGENRIETPTNHLHARVAAGGSYPKHEPEQEN